MPGSPRIVSSSGARRSATRANVVAQDLRARARARSAAGRSGGRSRARRRRGRRAGSRRRRAGEARAAWRTTCQVDSASRISPPAAERASRSATATASPITGGSPAATTSPVQAPERTPNGSSSRSSAAARSARCASSSCASGMPSTATTASLRSSTTLPPWLAEHRAAGRVEALDHRAQRLGVEPGLARAGRAARPRRSPSGASSGARSAAARRGLRHVLAQDRGLERAQARATARCRARRRARGARRGRRRARRPGGPRGRARASAARAAARAAGGRWTSASSSPTTSASTAAGEVRLDALAQAGQAQVLEPSRSRAGRSAPRPRPRAPARATARAPARSVAAASHGSPRASSSRPSRSRSSKRSASSAPGGSRSRVPAALRAHQLVAERRAQPRRDDVHGVARVLRALALPQLVHHAVEVDDVAAMHEQQREQRERATARGRERSGRLPASTSIGPRIRNCASTSGRAYRAVRAQ